MMVKDKRSTTRLPRGTVHCTNALIPLQSIKRPMAPFQKSHCHHNRDPWEHHASPIWKTYLKLDSWDENYAYPP